MSPSELRRAANDLVAEIGCNAKLSLYVNGDLHDQPIGAMLYNNDDTVRVDGKDWAEVFAQLRTEWAGEEEARRESVVRQMALYIVETGADNGIISERLLHLKFGLRDTKALSERALERAKHFSSRSYIIV
jgi:hypothetical protein